MLRPRRSARHWLAGLLVALAPSARADEPSRVDPTRSKLVVEALASSRPMADDLATTPLTRGDAAKVREILWGRRRAALKRERAAEVKAGKIAIGELSMPFAFKVFGEKPKAGRSLFLSMHGGGGAPARVNDQQYENQKKLYKPAEGVYLAPRAPTNTWDLWHQSHVDAFFARLIADMVAVEGVDPDRVYLMGYSAGGDGVYQLAPRMADRFAAASMMAGHPNESQPMGLRNLPFAVHVGAEDGGFNRNKVAREYGDKLDALAKLNPGGYPHLVEIHPGRGHWMNLEDASAVPWMAGFTRDPAPRNVAWLQDDVTHDRFYWLAVPPGTAKAGAVVSASVEGQAVRVDKADDVAELIVRLDDRLVDLDRPVEVGGAAVDAREVRASRTYKVIEATMREVDDPGLTFDAEVSIPIRRPRADSPR